MSMKICLLIVLGCAFIRSASSMSLDAFNFCAILDKMDIILPCTRAKSPPRSVEIFLKRSNSIPGVSQTELIETVCTIHNNAGNVLWAELRKELPVDELDDVDKAIRECFEHAGVRL